MLFPKKQAHAQTAGGRGKKIYEETKEIKFDEKTHGDAWNAWWI